MATIVSGNKEYEVFRWDRLDEIFSSLVNDYLNLGYKIDPNSISRREIHFKAKKEYGFCVMIKRDSKGSYDKMKVQAIRTDGYIIQEYSFCVLNKKWLCYEDAIKSVMENGFEIIEE